PGAVDAHLTPHRGRTEGGKAVSDSTITPAAGLTRREMVATLAAMSAGAALRPTTAQASEAARRTTLALAGGSYAPKIYTAHEWNTVQVLVDLIIPRDAKSGSATEAAVPEFMDQILFLEPG